MLKTIATISLLLIINSSIAQNINNKITTHIEILGKGNPASCRLADNESYFALFKLKNNTDSIIELFISDPFWFNSWISDNDSIIILNFAGDGGMFVPFKLASKKTLTFHGVIRAYAGNKTSSFKFGYVDFHHLMLISTKLEQQKLAENIYWSNKVKLKSKKIFSQGESDSFESYLPYFDVD